MAGSLIPTPICRLTAERLLQPIICEEMRILGAMIFKLPFALKFYDFIDSHYI